MEVYEKDKDLKSIENDIKKCRDFSISSPLLNKEDYLESFSSDNDGTYKQRLALTPLTNLIQPIVYSLVNLIHRKDCVLEGYDGLLDYNNVDNKGNNLNSFIKDVTFSSIVAGCEFIGVETLNKKIILKSYKYENLMSYKLDKVNNLKEIVFKDIVKVPNDKGFGSKELKRFLVFTPEGGSVWYSNDGSNDIKLQEEFKTSLGHIPIISINSGTFINDFIYGSKILDIVNLNICLYNFESQIAKIITLLGDPVPLLVGDAGFNKDNDNKLHIGSSKALVLADNNSDYRYAELRGEGVKLIFNEIEVIKDDINSKSFNLLGNINSKTVVEAQDTQNKSSSFCIDISRELESKFTSLFQIISNVKGVKNKGKITFKKDFDDLLYSNKVLELLLKMTSEGMLSKESLLDKLKNIGILKNDFNIEEEIEKLNSETSDMATAYE